MKLGILGGSFDPPHAGHVLLAAYALSVCELDRVLVAPVFQHALEKQLTPFADRLHMCELAFGTLRDVEVTAIERELGGTSRTLRLIEALAQQNPGASFRLIVGADILLEAERWQAFDEVRARAPLFVAARAGIDCPELDARAPVLPEISSTEVRAALVRGDDVSAWVPRKVIDYARARRLYADAP